MATRIDGSAAQSTQYPVETTEPEVQESRGAHGPAAASAPQAAERGPVDSIERARESKQEEEPGPEEFDVAEGPSLSAHSLQVTGGKSGHQAMEEAAAEKAEDRSNLFRAQDKWSSSRTLSQHTKRSTLERKGFGLERTARSQHQAREEKFQRVDHPGLKVGVKVLLGEKHEHGETAVWKTDSKNEHFHAAVDELEGAYGWGAALNKDGLKAHLAASGAAYLVNMQLKGEYQGALGKISGEGYANVGASAAGQLELEVNPLKGTMAARAGAEAFVGAKAGLKAKGSAAGVEVGGEAQVRAGLGASAQGEVELKEGRFELKGDMGLCVGLGADVKVDVAVDAHEVVANTEEADRFVAQTEDAALAFAAKAGTQLANTALGVAANGLAGAAGEALSVLEGARRVAHAVQDGAELLKELSGQ